MLTHGDDGRDLAGTGVEEAGTGASRGTTFPALSVVSRGLTVSTGATAVTRATVSAGAAGLGFDCADSLGRAVTLGVGSRAREPSTTAATNTPPATHLAVSELPLRTFSGVRVVPHHLHEWTCAG
jgi:hypothetical protein